MTMLEMLSIPGAWPALIAGMRRNPVAMWTDQHEPVRSERQVFPLYNQDRRHEPGDIAVLNPGDGTPSVWCKVGPDGKLPPWPGPEWKPVDSA